MTPNIKLPTKPDIWKGDYVRIGVDIFPSGFLGICLDNYRNRPIRFCDVYGLFHEMGSVYAGELTKLDVDGDVPTSGSKPRPAISTIG